MRHHIFSGLPAVAVALLLTACSTAAQQRKALPTDVVATVAGTSITLEQLDERAMQQSVANFGNLKLSQAIYEARRAAADEIIGNVLLDQEAKRRGLERTVLFEQEITSKVKAVTDADA